MSRESLYYSTSFCNNCGKPGHIFTACKKPILSMGIIAFKKDDDGIKYLSVCRKDSLGYIDFIRGKYSLYDKEYIQQLIDEMTIQEKEDILSKDFKYLWKNLWGTFATLQYRSEEKHAQEKFSQLKRGIKLNKKIDCNYNLKDLITNSKTRWETPEWGFPKGKRNYQETDFKCAIREFQEETGFSLSDLDVISNIVPYEEIFIGSNYKTYKHRYYIANFIGDINGGDFQKSEIGDMQWLSFKECIRIIRPYNIEKKKMLEKIHITLNNYKLI